MSRVIFFWLGIACGVWLSVSLDNRNPSGFLFAFACDALGMPAARTLDGELVCLHPGAIIGEAQSMETILSALKKDD